MGSNERMGLLGMSGTYSACQLSLERRDVGYSSQPAVFPQCVLNIEHFFKKTSATERAQLPNMVIGS